MKNILPFCTAAALAMMCAPISRAEPTAPTTPAAPAAVSDDVIKAFKSEEGSHLGTSSFPMGALKKEVNMGSLKGVWRTETEAINAARVSPGTEVVMRAKGPDGKLYFANFAVEEFDEIGRTMSLDPNAGRFVVVERDPVAEEKYRVTNDVRQAVHQANEVFKNYKPMEIQPSLRRYNTGTPARKKLCELPEN